LGYNGNPNLKLPGTKQSLTLEQIQELYRCSIDPVYWAEKYIKIVSVDYGVIPIKLYDFQKEIIEATLNNRRVIVLTGRQQGKTTVATIVLLHFAIFNNAKRIGLLANKADSAREILDRIQMAYENLPRWMQIGVKEWNKGSVEFANESKIIAAASSSSSIRGKSMAFLYIDETAFVENWTDFYASTFPTISSGKTTKMLFTSTPNGLNHFYDFWKGATDGTPDESGKVELNGFTPIFAPWYKIPNRDDKWKSDTLKALNYDFDRFRQEYEGEFLGSAGTLLNSSTLGRLLPVPPITSNDFLKQFELPEKDRIYFMTCDVSRGKGLDYSAFSVFDVTEVPYRQVCIFRNNKITPTDYASWIYRIAKMYNNAYTIVETNDLGEQVAVLLQYDYGYENILSTESAGRAGKRLSTGFGRGVEIGLRTTTTVKRLGCSVLKLMLEQNTMLLRDEATIKELRTFSKKGDGYSAEPGNHDDMVMTLVLLAFLTQDNYFHELANGNILPHMRDFSDEDIENDLIPFGYVNNQDTTNAPTYVKFKGEKGVWEEKDPDDSFRW